MYQPSKAEQIVSRSLRALVADVPVGGDLAASEQLAELSSALEYFVPEMLAEVYPDFCEGLDGVYPAFARKSGEREAEVFGLCILIADQTLTPLHLRLQACPSQDEISWMECRLGEKRNGEMVRIPYPAHGMAKHLHALQGRLDSVDWAYKVTFGSRLVE
jgi:hypothetical protein